ncbi:MAG: helix-turn-helix domain-containing protein [Actinomycetes bacterium]
MATHDPGGRWTPIRSPEALGRTIRRAREQTGLTQVEMAARARATRQAIIALESGHETRALELIFDALAALGLELAVRPRAQ